MSLAQEQTQEPELNEFQKYNASVDVLTLPMFSRGQLSQYNGVDKPELYVAIRGWSTT